MKGRRHSDIRGSGRGLMVWPVSSSAPLNLVGTVLALASAAVTFRPHNLALREYYRVFLHAGRGYAWSPYRRFELASAFPYWDTQ